MLNYKIREILAARGKTAGPNDLVLQDDSDGNGPYIRDWDAVKLGPKPTAAELDAAAGTAFANQAAADLVRAEAYRRIVALAPEWKQRNMTARGLELTRKELAGGTLTAAEQAEAAAITAAWDAVKAIRAASDVLEANPPADYTDDSHWPAGAN